ncbi:MAG: SpoIIE family protein phosphatase [candidate division Zixibacteria bacterium]|nr:SpoIIE family protein phosphatase [candidate division Zixibacteria bacterium]
MDKTTLLLEAAEILNSDINVKPLLKNILNITVKYLNASAASLFLINPKLKQLDLYLMAGEEDPRIWASHLSLGQGIAGWVAEHGEPVLTNDARSDPRFYTGLENMADFRTGALICVPIRRHDKILGVVEALNPQGGDKFTDDDMGLLMALSGQMAVSLENAILIDKLQKNSREKELLIEISKKLNTFLELNEILDYILDSLTEVVEYDMAGIFLVDRETGDIIPEVEKSKTRGEDEVLFKNLLLKIGDGLVGWVGKTGKSVIVSDVSIDPRYIKFRKNTSSEMVVPIKSEDNILGVLNIESDQVNKYDNEDLRLVEAFAGQAAVAIERAHLSKEILEQRMLAEELEIARRIQLSFLPSRQPEIEGFQVWAFNRSYHEVGGDYYDFIPIVENQTGIAIGDVVGKGIPAALLMAAFRASLIAEIRNNYAIRTILSKVNNLLYESMERSNFVTAVYGVLDSRNSIFTFSNAGHNLPLLFRSDGSIEKLSEGGLALGIVYNQTYIEQPAFLRPGDWILFYTDGVTETFNEKGKEYGEEKLVELVKQNLHLTPKQLADEILKDLGKFRRGAPQSDDYTMILLKKT